jgi:hypothetical protein
VYLAVNAARQSPCFKHQILISFQLNLLFTGILRCLPILTLQNVNVNFIQYFLTNPPLYGLPHQFNCQIGCAVIAAAAATRYLKHGLLPA